ncbi:DMT family transporter [Clostridium sp. HCP1S3_B4]|uniref:DMT family transporter n=1 Tax=unclassified Clostridium TaxID=2614128 RepID=UPI003F89FF9F|nr:DMT family transporter [Clostridiales bacterium]
MDKVKFYTNKINIVILACISCILWGSAYPAIKIGYELFNIESSDIGGKLIFAGVRFFIAGIIVLLFEIINKKESLMLNKKSFKKVLTLGIIQTTLQYTFFYVGMAYVAGVRGSILNGTGTFFSIILAHFIYKNDSISFNKLLGCITGFAGVVIINLNGSFFLGSDFTFKGEGCIILAALMFSVSSIYGKSITKEISPTITTGYQLALGGFILIIIGFVLGGRLTGFTLKSTSLLIYMALISSVAFALWTELLKYNKVSTISIFNFLVPVFGSILSAIFLKENLFDIKVLISLILVCIGIFLVYREKNYK